MVVVVPTQGPQTRNPYVGLGKRRSSSRRKGKYQKLHFDHKTAPGDMITWTVVIALKYSFLSGLDWGLAMSGRSDSGHRVATLGSKHGQAGAVPLFPM